MVSRWQEDKTCNPFRNDALYKVDTEKEFDENIKTQDFFITKNKGARANKIRLDRKYKKKRRNPNLKNPWKRRKQWMHRDESYNHRWMVKTREKVAKREFREWLVRN